jgi:hypothetical protein
MEATMKLVVSIALLSCLSSPILAQTEDNARLNELRTAPEPKQQKDLDTLQLASAHRERSESMQERTNGLWQSWTTSICEGCGGNTPSYRKTIQDDFANRKSFVGLSPGAPAVAPDPSPRRAAAPARDGRQLYSDLSTENIDQIRRMPRR